MRRIALALMICLVPGFALAQSPGAPNSYPPPPPQGDQTVPTSPPPPTAAPDQEPPSDYAPPPPPVAVQPQVSPQALPPSNLPSGQWVYTNQYGWLWMPHGQNFVYIPADPQAYPNQYVYYPVYGWRWVVAPWVYGYGPVPYWGSYGIQPFAWYARPWFRVGGYWGWGAYRGWGHYRGWIGPQTWGGRGWSSAPAYYRNGYGRSSSPPRPAMNRPAPSHSGNRYSGGPANGGGRSAGGGGGGGGGHFSGGSGSHGGGGGGGGHRR